MTTTRRSWWTVQGVLVIGLAALLVSACSGLNPFESSALGPPLPVIVRDSINAYQSARSVQIRGSYADGSIPVTVRVAVRPSTGGVFSGHATYDGTALSVVGENGKVFTTGLRYWQAQGAQGLHIWPQYGAGWVLAPSRDPAASAITAAADLGGLLDQFQQHSSALVSAGTSRLGGQEIASLRDGQTVYDVSTAPPYRLLAIRRAGTSTPIGGLRDLNLVLTYGGRLKVTPPTSGHFVDPGDASTFPALYEVQSMSDIQSCDQSSCGFTATLINTTGAQLGQVTATLSLYQDAQLTQLLGSCSAPVPQVATGQTANVSCRITAPSYQSFETALTQNATVYRHVTIQNPPYS
jgi:hypothetical protein